MLAFQAPARGEVPRIHLRGTSQMEAHAARAAGRLLLSGMVVDDLGRPLAGQRVALDVSRVGGSAGANGGGGETVSLADASPAACSDGATPPTIESPTTLVLAADEAGRFCVRLALPVDRYVARLESRTSGLVDGARIELPVDLALAPVTLRFDPEPAVLSLDDDGITVEVVASTEDDGVTSASVGLALTLTNERGATLGTARTGTTGRARFGVDPHALGPPGRGELRVAFAGSRDAGAATRAVAIQRRTRVELTAPEATEGRLPAAAADDGIPIRVVATTRAAGGDAGANAGAGAPTGSIEARLGDAIVGAAPLDRGAATVVISLPAAGNPDAESIEVRYVPDAPWFLAQGDLPLVLPLRPPSPWRKAPLVLAALGVLAWLAAARLRPKVARHERPSRAPEAAIVEAGIALVEAGRADEGWRGRLVDAHEGRPLAGARVAVERRGFDGIHLIQQAWSKDDGSFELPHIDPVPGDELVAEGTVHVALRRPLPPPGVIQVALVARKRALIERLVAWARARGGAFDARPEPTPGHVRRAAGSEFVVARWAEEVERAAYGGQPVDARAEADIDRLAPAAAVPPLKEPRGPV